MERKRIRIRKSALLLLMLTLLFKYPDCCGAADMEGQVDEVRIECVSAQMPDMKIYCYPNKKELLDEVSVTYGGEELKVVQKEPYEQSRQGISYYILLDVSASVSPEYFAGMKNSISDFWKNLTVNDRMTLVTFGDDVDIVFQDKTMADDITETLKVLKNTDQTTKLFEAIQKTAELADTKENAGVRKIMLALTDGEDFTENSATKDEALSALNEKRIPLYAMGAKEMYGNENTYLDGMGEFVRSTGGQMEIFDSGNAVLKMQEMHKVFQEAFVIIARARTNMVDYQSKSLNVCFSNDKIYTVDYTASYYREDRVVPAVIAEKYSDCALRLKFSEPVRRADEIASYEMERDGAKITDGYMVRYEDSGDAEAIITFENKLRNGEYAIRFHGITDASMEANELKKTASVKVTNGTMPGVVDYIREYQAFIAGLIVLAVLLAALIIGWKNVKKRSGVITIDGKAVLQSNLEKKYRVEVKKVKAAGRRIQFYLDGAVGQQQITAEVTKSMIVGRSQNCDISINDEKISRQHFAISDRKGQFYIEDLHTTNGTWVNGKKLSFSMKLNPGDTIRAGDVAMTVRW